MRIGWIGLGKLGLPAALTLSAYGKHEVFGYDTSDEPRRALTPSGRRRIEFDEEYTLEYGTVTIVNSLAELLERTSVIFVAVQTPHAAEFGGEVPLRSTSRRGFDHSHVREVVAELTREARVLGVSITIIVVSTVMPGTVETELLPLCSWNVTLLYHPYFIALGRVSDGIRLPELTVIGAWQPEVDEVSRAELSSNIGELIAELYPWSGAWSTDPVVTDYPTAELLKLLVNAHQSVDIAFTNQVGVVGATVGADVDTLLNALKLRYRPGLPDGGPCRPRDLIALSSLERALAVPGFFECQVTLRQEHAAWLAKQLHLAAESWQLPICLLGVTYKPDVPLGFGSPALLISALLTELQVEHTLYNHTLPHDLAQLPRAIYLVNLGTEVVIDSLPSGSVVLDPWGIVPSRTGLVIIRPHHTDTERRGE